MPIMPVCNTFANPEEDAMEGDKLPHLEVVGWVHIQSDLQKVSLVWTV